MTDKKKFQIFRAADAPDLEKTESQTMSPLTPAESTGFGRMVEAGVFDGSEVHVLASLPGFSLVHLWFKKDFPLPLHSHDANCLYYIVAGSLRLGDKTLGKGDGFFIPSDMPYTYRAGPEGVELVEFRTAERFDFQFRADTPAFWKKAADICAANQADWKTAALPQR